MTKSNIKLDKRDRIILDLLNTSPKISQEEIAKKIHLSQPSVAMRIKKLREKGFIEPMIGVNINKVGLYMAQVRITTANTTKILNTFRDCPFFLNGFIISGKDNLCLLFVGEDIASLEAIVDGHLRPDKDVHSVNFDIIVSSIKDFVMPIKIGVEPTDKPPCGIKIQCQDCPSYQGNRCFGCPATKQYKGLFW